MKWSARYKKNNEANKKKDSAMDIRAVRTKRPGGGIMQPAIMKVSVTRVVAKMVSNLCELLVQIMLS